MTAVPPSDRLVSLIMPAWRPDPRWLREAVAPSPRG